MAEPLSAAQEASDPSTSPERLLELTEKHPQLQRLIVLNPSCPDVAREWILATNTWARRAYEENLATAPADGEAADEEAADGGMDEDSLEASVWGDLATPAAAAASSSAPVTDTAPQEIPDEPPAPSVRIAQDASVVPLGPAPTTAPAPVHVPGRQTSPTAPSPAPVPAPEAAAATASWSYDAPAAPGAVPPAATGAAPVAFGAPLAASAPVPAADPGQDDGSRRRRAAWWACGGCLLLALILLLGTVLVGRAWFTGGEDEEPSAAATTTTAQESPTEEPTEEATTEEETTADPVSPAPDGAQEMTELRSPSGNISCLLEEDSVACSVLEHDYSGSSAEGCEDGPFSIEVAEGDPARRCGSSYLSDSAGTLPYDRSATHGNVACTSRFDGMTCWNTITGKGFMVNRATYETF